MSTVETEVLVVGAGLSGLMAANALRQYNLKVTLLDKGRSVGGRLATRRIGAGRADHGAQFFTVRSHKFQAFVNRWLAADVVYEWSTGWNDGLNSQTVSDGHPRYAVRGGMNRLAKHLAEDLEVKLEVRLVAVSPTVEGWQAEDEQGQRYQSRALLLTPPVPQSLQLLTAGQTPLTSQDEMILKKIEYAPCLAGLFVVEGANFLPEPGAVQLADASINWIANNQRKGISPEATVITVHAGPEYSRHHWETEETRVMADLEAGLRRYLSQSTKIIEAQYKRWRYALPTSLYAGPCLLAKDLPPLVFAGDAFGGPRIEGAALSGLAAAQALAETMTETMTETMQKEWRGIR